MNQGSLNGSLNMHKILKHWGEVENEGYLQQRLGRTISHVRVKWRRFWIIVMLVIKKK